MTNTMMNNGQVQRKTLATQLDRLDVILDGLADALNGAVEMAVRDVVGVVVKETVESTLKEVLSNPDLLRAALAQHVPQPQPQPVPTPMPKRCTLKELLQSAASKVDAKASQLTAQASQKLSSAWTWCLGKLRQGDACVRERCKQVANRCVRLYQTICGIGRGLWQFRRSFTFALSVGVVSGVGCYLAGPLFASVASGLGGAALTLAAMILLPLWRLMVNDHTTV